MQSRKFGRLPRRRDPRVPHMAALLAGQTLAPVPETVDHTAGMPADLGPMLNDTLSNCTCAAFYHAVQVWSFNNSAGQRMETARDDAVLRLYEEACGYQPDVRGSDPGGDVQTVLTYLLQAGAPAADGSDKIHKLSAFVEVDPRNIDDVKRAVAECGVVYYGFQVPRYIVPDNAPTPEIWDVQDGDTDIAGSHCVVLAGYTPASVRVVSWGRFYTMTLGFFAKYANEAYALADRTWLAAKRGTAAGLSLAELEAQMQALAGAELALPRQPRVPVWLNDQARKVALT